MRMESKTRAIDKIHKRRDRYEIPDWQRGEVWGRSKKQSLLDTILKGWKLPKFYLLKTAQEPVAYEVVDGQQRLLAIWEFFEDELALGDVKDLGGKLYSQLPDDIADSFDDYEIEFDEIEDASDEDVKTFFQRLQDGLPLTSAEKLNSVHSKLRNFVHKLTKHTFIARVAASDRRYGHFDVLAKVAAIEIDGIEVALRYDDLLAVFESQAAFSAQSNVAKRIRAALDFADKALDDDGARLLRNRTIVQSFLTLACRLIQTGKVQGQEERVGKFFVEFLGELGKQVELGHQATDTDYIEFQRTVNANIRSGAAIRRTILLRKLLVSDPEFSEFLDPATVLESGIEHAMDSEAAQIVKMVGEHNEKYSAQHGMDLFKATNKTAQAQGRLAKPIRNFEDYKTFIDDLYHLFHEGPGERLAGNMPTSFRDVKILRTDLRHDVDHGKTKKVKAKKKKMGAVFGNYAGAPSPSGLDPARFIVAQFKILTALKQDLGKLQP